MSARIPLPSADELQADVAELLALTAPPGREAARTMAVLARQRDLLAPFLTWAAALALNGALPKRDHEMLALRVAWNCRSAFEWSEHFEFALAAGLTHDEIASIVPASMPGAWVAHEAALLRAADELHATCNIADQTWDVLADHYDASQLVEIIFVVGQYTMLSMVANAAGIEPEPGLAPLPEPDSPPRSAG